MTKAAWIAVDWGTSRLRAWAMATDGQCLAERCSDDGMSRLERSEFEATLLRMVEPWLTNAPVPVLACGMVGARQGWQEVGYASVPVNPAGLSPVSVSAKDDRIRLSIIPGLCQAKSPDVMRGEETQIAGFLAQHPDFDGVLCLPGTHCKWALLSAGEVVSFQTAMTGELYHLIANHSVIGHALEGDGLEDKDAFAEAVSDMLSKPEMLSHRIFSIRAASVLQNVPAATSRSQLTGLLIGAELAATRPYWLGQRVAVAAEPLLADMYQRALLSQGVPAEMYDAAPLTRAGLAAAYENMSELAG